MLISSVWRGAARYYFMVGLLLGGAAVALLAVVIGSLVIRPWWPGGGVSLAVIAGMLCLALLHDSGMVRFSIPQNARQVPEAVGSAGPRQGALQFGFEMGTGMRTFMTSLLPHVVLVGLLVELPLVHALAVGVSFGVGRALVPIARGVGDNEFTWSLRFSKRERAIQVLLGASLAGTAVASYWV